MAAAGEPAARRRPSARDAAASPRQSDIARLAGVSQWTVSVVINGRAEAHHIPEGTREKILGIARELGYVPNAAARNLRGGLNRLVGLFAYQSTFPMAQQSSYYGYLLGVEKEAERRGYDLILFTSIVGAERAQDRGLYRDGANRLNLADGAVMLGLDTDRAELLRLSQEGYRFVYIGRREVPGAHIAYVAPDYRQASVDAVDALVARGHRKIGYVAARGLGATSDEPHQDRHEGYKQAREARRLPETGVEDTTLDDVSAGWLRSARDAGVSAVVAENASGAERLMGLCRSAAIRIPQDLSVVVLDDAVGGPRRGAAWSCTAIPREAVGARAMSLLIEILQGEADTDAPHELIRCAKPSLGTLAPAATA